MSLEQELIKTIKNYNMGVVKNDNKLIVSRNNVIKTDSYALNLLLFGSLNG